jgi:AcrR family transcriptional regulator
VTRTRPSDTRERIRAVARELFARQGIKQTSLREIAERVGITKPALYYHFDSREALVRSIVQPLIDETDAFVAEREHRPTDPRTLLGDYFDLIYRNRDILRMLVIDLSTLGELDLATRMFGWRHRLIVMLIGPAPALNARARAVVALGGLSDCAIEFVDVPAEQIKPPALDAACAALGVSGTAT